MPGGGCKPAPLSSGSVPELSREPQDVFTSTAREMHRKVNIVYSGGGQKDHATGIRKAGHPNRRRRQPRSYPRQTYARLTFSQLLGTHCHELGRVIAQTSRKFFCSIWKLVVTA